MGDDHPDTDPVTLELTPMEAVSLQNRLDEARRSYQDKEYYALARKTKRHIDKIQRALEERNRQLQEEG